MSIPIFVKKDKGNPPNARSLREVQIRGGLVPPGKSFSRFLFLHFLFFIRTLFFRLSLGKEIEITTDN